MSDDSPFGTSYPYPDEEGDTIPPESGSPISGVDLRNIGDIDPDPVTVRLGGWEPPEQYNRPHLEPDGQIRTKEHDVLGKETVVQVLGKKPTKFVLRGDAFAEDIRFLRTLEGKKVSIRHEIFSGNVIVERVSAVSTSSYETEANLLKWVYNYTIDLIATQ